MREIGGGPRWVRRGGLQSSKPSTINRYRLGDLIATAKRKGEEGVWDISFKSACIAGFVVD